MTVRENEVSPVNRTPRGTYIKDGQEYYPATLLAGMNVPGLPKSRAGIYKFAERNGWAFINVPGKGAKDGIRCFLVPNWVFERGDWSDPEQSKPYIQSQVEPLTTGDGTNRALPLEDRHDADTVDIDYYPEVRGSAGPGALNSNNGEVVIKVKMDAKLLRERVGNNFSQLKLASVSGDSMYSTLAHGDQVLIDTSVTRFIDDAIYAIVQDGFLRYKRVQKRLDGSIVVKSDNPTAGEPEVYKPEEAQHFHVVGIVLPFKFGRFKI